MDVLTPPICSSRFAQIPRKCNICACLVRLLWISGIHWFVRLGGLILRSFPWRFTIQLHISEFLVVHMECAEAKIGMTLLRHEAFCLELDKLLHLPCLQLHGWMTTQWMRIMLFAAAVSNNRSQNTDKHCCDQGSVMPSPKRTPLRTSGQSRQRRDWKTDEFKWSRCDQKTPNPTKMQKETHTIGAKSLHAQHFCWGINFVIAHTHQLRNFNCRGLRLDWPATEWETGLESRMVEKWPAKWPAAISSLPRNGCRPFFGYSWFWARFPFCSRPAKSQVEESICVMRMYLWCLLASMISQKGNYTTIVLGELVSNCTRTSYTMSSIIVGELVV